MLFPAIAAFFRHKIVSYVTVLACWSSVDQVHFANNLTEYGLRVTITCDPRPLDLFDYLRFHGVITFSDSVNFPFHKLKPDHYTSWYKWLIIGDSVPSTMMIGRYDADIALLNNRGYHDENGDRNQSEIGYTKAETYLPLLDVYFHGNFGVSLHPWAEWSPGDAGLQILHDTERIKRRLDLKGYPIRISTPLAQYSSDLFNGTFLEYLTDTTNMEMDGTIKCTYLASVMITEVLNATDVLLPTLYWTSEASNSSMILMVRNGEAEIAGGGLRIIRTRIERLDYVMAIWPFSVGFTYLAERESSGNMFLAPFSWGVWATCGVAIIVLSVMQKITAQDHKEKEGALLGVVATWLQQDANTVPAGSSGRWTFTVMCLCSMLVHAYYTSAIVSALMSAGRSGPATLRELADSKYSIASADYDYMRYYMFDRDSKREDLEYLKRKKMTASFYQPLSRGVKLISDGNTAYHGEYNNLFPQLKSFTDDKICKLAYVDTIPKTLSYVVTNKRSQFTNVMRIVSYWIHETGHRSRLVSRYRSQPAPCRSAMLAERVKFGDIAPMYAAVAGLAACSVLVLGAEILLARWSGRGASNGDAVRVE
uniref:Putative ionotropic receptor 27 n=1 Tax=Conopomorpha sinensis TaxID=940481 RepID=A0A3Q8HDV9_9NEOP|nr:putative ionotropic receptor 27 [Conopomorpha sinensis]